MGAKPSVGDHAFDEEEETKAWSQHPHGQVSGPPGQPPPKSHLHAQLRRLRKQLDHLRTRQRQQMGSTTLSMARLQKINQAREAENAHLRDAVQHLEHQHEEGQVAASRVVQAEAERTAATREVEVLRSRLEQLQQQRDEGEQATAARVARAEWERRAAAAEVKALTRRLQQLQQGVDKAASLQAEQAEQAKRAEQAEHAEQLARLRSTVSTLTQQVTEANDFAERQAHQHTTECAEAVQAVRKALVAANERFEAESTKQQHVITALKVQLGSEAQNETVVGELREKLARAEEQHKEAARTHTAKGQQEVAALKERLTRAQQLRAAEDHKCQQSIAALKRRLVEAAEERRALVAQAYSS